MHAFIGYEFKVPRLYAFVYLESYLDALKCWMWPSIPARLKPNRTPAFRKRTLNISAPGRTFWWWPSSPCWIDLRRVGGDDLGAGEAGRLRRARLKCNFRSRCLKKRCHKLNFQPAKKARFVFYRWVRLFGA